MIPALNAFFHKPKRGLEPRLPHYECGGLPVDLLRQYKPATYRYARLQPNWRGPLLVLEPIPRVRLISMRDDGVEPSIFEVSARCFYRQTVRAWCSDYIHKLKRTYIVAAVTRNIPSRY